jgi:hypothetical protein
MRRLIYPILMTFAAAAFAQKQPADATTTSTTAQTAPAVITDTDSRETREQFRELLRRTPPEVGMVLKLDPTLFTNQQYLATYPALASFVAQHPEVTHNPGFYLDTVYTPREHEPNTGARMMWDKMMEGFMILFIFSTIVGVIVWLIRTLIEQRRWGRLSRVQTEVHGKVLDRLTSNEELLRYMETPAGRRFLESAPIPLEAGPRPVSAPVGRILWSIQTGLVISAAGVGMEVVSYNIDKDASQPVYALGMIALCVGVGFVLSAVVAFILSRRLKLLEAPEPPSV